MSDIGSSVTGYGTLLGNNTSAGAQIANIAAANLPAGTYCIEVWGYIQAAASAALADNGELRAGSTPLGRILMFNAVAGTGTPLGPKLKVYKYLDGRTALSVNFVANFGAAETQTWNVQIVATRVENY